MSDRIDFRIQLSKSSPYVPLVKYLSKKNKTKDFTRIQMILGALSAFWNPLVCRWRGGFSDEQLKQEARESIHQLLMQLFYLAKVFGLEAELRVLYASALHTSANTSYVSPQTACEQVNCESLTQTATNNDGIAPNNMTKIATSLDSNHTVLLGQYEDDELFEQVLNQL